MFDSPVRRGDGLAVLKVAAGSATEVQVLHGEPVGIVVHWLAGRTWFCPGERCPVCLSGIGGRWSGWYLVKVLCRGQGKAFGLELSAPAFDQMLGLVRMECAAIEPGQVFQVSRRRAKSALCVEPVALQAGALIDEAASRRRLLRGLATLYRLPPLINGTSEEDWCELVERHAFAALAAAMG